MTEQQEPFDFDAWQRSLRPVWTGYPKSVEFTYKDRDGKKERRKVNVSKVLVSDRMNVYLYGYCQARQDYRTFAIHRIESKIRHDKKYYYPLEFQELLGVTDADIENAWGGWIDSDGTFIPFKDSAREASPAPTEGWKAADSKSGCLGMAALLLLPFVLVILWAGA
ncbi:WYL domain-containing protein [Methylomagnum ishizawai]|uniref:WYL domain-containing protein n=1 Tax=Methylomagnum ishizawai TaxID=1760988 RepID=A0A1Y6D388_9GAMM|nr:WYL domain-containing protein [Methylomagnum ishizawai]SMF94445.1 WYL domain-containing protein [Methylomagnum ishizawai]